MSAGPKDRRVQFRRQVLVDDGLAQVGSFSDLGFPVWAERKDISDGERWRAGEVQAHVTTRFRVRSNAFTRAITPKDRLVCEGREFEIVGIKEVGARQTDLEITAAARIDG